MNNDHYIYFLRFTHRNNERFLPFFMKIRDNNRLYWLLTHYSLQYES